MDSDNYEENYLATLGHLLRQPIDSKDKKQIIQKLQREYERGIQSEDFTQFMDRKINESVYNRSEIAIRAGLSRDYCYKLLRGDKKAADRDYIIALCMALKLSLFDVQKALDLYPFPQLDASDRRSAIIMIAIMNGYSMEELNEWLDEMSFEMLRISPEMPTAKIRPLRSTNENEHMIYSNPKRGQGPQTSKGDIIMKNKIRVEWEQMGCMPCDMGITGELQTNEFGNSVFVTVSYTPDGDFYTINNVSIFEDEDRFSEEIVEEYEGLREAMESKYYKDFITIDKELEKRIAEKNTVSEDK